LEDFDKIQTRSARSFSETLLYLLQRYACTIQADAQRFPDISLFDHSKTAAALAVCLFDLQENAIETDKPFLLIGADFSGIQSYLYQIVSKYAAKNLKGRSFYLRMLSDAAALYLLKALDLPQANIIYNSGGGFYMIAPNTENIRQKLTDVGKHMEEKCLKLTEYL
jgi:CRISPR-associated protein Csm1